MSLVMEATLLPQELGVVNIALRGLDLGEPGGVIEIINAVPGREDPGRQPPVSVIDILVIIAQGRLVAGVQVDLAVAEPVAGGCGVGQQRHIAVFVIIKPYGGVVRSVDPGDAAHCIVIIGCGSVFRIGEGIDKALGGIGKLYLPCLRHPGNQPAPGIKVSNRPSTWRVSGSRLAGS